MYNRFEARWMKHIDFFILDILALQFAAALSYFLRFGAENTADPDFYVKVAVILAVMNCCVALFDETYHSILKRGYLKEATACVKHTAFVLASVVLFFYTIKENAQMSRLFFFYLSLSTLVFMWAFRCIWKYVLVKRIQDHPEKKYHLAVLTTRDNLPGVLESLKKGNYHISAICLTDGSLEDGEQYSVPLVTELEDLLDFIRKNVVDGLFLSLPEGAPMPAHVLNTCIDMGVSTHISLMRSDLGDNRQVVERMGEDTVLTRSVWMATTGQLFLKRAVDICAGLVGMVVVAICCLFVAPAIYIASPGPIFFTQTRVGKNGRKFKIYKFRSMYMDAEERKKELMANNKIADGMMFKMDDDPRIIKGIGHFIRNTSIDELPQLWNILKGDMSLIGTRPPTVEEYEKYAYHHKIRLSIKPGITGMWQVSGRSNITDFEQVVALDASYITNWSLGLDVKILLKTVKVVLGRDGAS